MEQTTLQSPDAAERVIVPSAPVPTSAWCELSHFSFRFCFVYFGLFILLTQMLGSLLVLPIGELPDVDAFPPLRSLVSWVARQVFHVRAELVIDGSGSGDKIYDWAKALCLLVMSVIAAAVWTILARQKPLRVGPRKWFRLIVRLAVGSTMIGYGMVKAIPLQMPFPPLMRLLEPYGNFSPMGVLWYSVGAAPTYESFAGSAELLAGVLLFIPATATLGALICLADSIQIFALNVSYDVPVKLFSFHLVLFSLFLLAPEARRLIDVLLLDRPTAASTQPPLMQSRRGNRAALICQAVFCVYLFGLNLFGGLMGWRQYGAGGPKSPLYGIWNVTEMAIDGQVRAPLLTDYDRFRRVVFQQPTMMGFQRMDDTFVSYVTAFDAGGSALKLTKKEDKLWSATWTFQRPTVDKLTLDGDLDGHRIHLQLQRFDEQKFLLVSRGFHWSQEYPLNR